MSFSSRLAHRLLLACVIAMSGGGCSQGDATDTAERDQQLHQDFQVQPAEDRIVLTPGGSSELRIELKRPAGSFPVQLKVAGAADDLEVALADSSSSVAANNGKLTLVTSDDRVVLSVASTDATRARETQLEFGVKAGNVTHDFTITVSVQVPDVAIEDRTEEYAPGVIGVTKTVQTAGGEVAYQIINGLAIVEGDIVLGNAAEVEAFYRASADGLMDKSLRCGSSDIYSCNRFTDGVMNYRFGGDWGTLNALMRLRIRAAMDDWENVTGIRFIEDASAGELVEFRRSLGCSSSIGRVIATHFDVQSIDINTGCSQLAIRHEIAHALGLGHEQSRSDRGDFVVVDLDNVEAGQESQFRLRPELIRSGPYDLLSNMHYRRDAFALNGYACNSGDFSACTIRTIDEDLCLQGVAESCAVPSPQIRGPNLSNGDVLGMYALYPPSYEIVGATETTVDHVTLATRFESGLPRIPAPDRIVWATNRATAPLGTGPSITIRASDVPAGENLITASYVIAGTAVAARRLLLNFENQAPSVSVDVTSGTPEKQAGVSFGVRATVADTEDGGCPEGTCDYSWSPEPTSGATDRPVAFYRFDDLGPHTIAATVEDAGGAVGSAELEVTIVNSVPVAEIIRPTGGSNVSTGTPLQLEGTASDANWSGALPCSAFHWTSSDPADVFTPSSNTCSPQVSFTSAGAHTLTLVVDDPVFSGSSAPVSVTVGVFSCTPGACPPTATLSLSRPNFEDRYFIEHTMQMVVSLAHADAPSDNPISYRLLLRRIGMADVVIAAGATNLASPLDISDIPIEWTPEDDLENWPDCVTEPRVYQLILEASDASGTTTTETRVIALSCDLI